MPYMTYEVLCPDLITLDESFREKVCEVSVELGIVYIR